MVARGKQLTQGAGGLPRYFVFIEGFASFICLQPRACMFPILRVTNCRRFPDSQSRRRGPARLRPHQGHLSPVRPRQLTRTPARARSRGGVGRRPPPPAVRSRRSAPSKKKQTGGWGRACPARGPVPTGRGERTSISQAFSVR